MKFPKGLTLKEKKILKEIYEETFQDRKKKSGKKKARYAARAKFYEEAFKIFISKQNKKTINEIWESKREKQERLNPTYIKENIDYKVYKVNGIRFYVSTDEKILDKFSDAEGSGMLKNMNDEFEQEILFKTKEKYDVSLHPEMYYVIRKGKD